MIIILYYYVLSFAKYKIRYNNIITRLSFTGQVLDEERRMVVCRDPLGDPAPGQVAAVRGVARPQGGREPVAHARGRRPVRVPGPASVQQGHLRPDARVLEAAGVGPTHVPGDPPVPAAQEPRLRARRRCVMTVRRWRRRSAGRATRRVAVRAPAKRVVPAGVRCRLKSAGKPDGTHHYRFGDGVGRRWACDRRTPTPRLIL